MDVVAQELKQYQQQQHCKYVQLYCKHITSDSLMHHAAPC